MIRSEKSAINFLEARDSRQDALALQLGKGYSATIFLSLNIPGYEKTPPGTEALFLWVFTELANLFSGLVTLVEENDALGPYAIMGIDLEPQAVKKECIALESGHVYARLVDIDVYSADGRQIDRGSLGLPTRTCLLCAQPAVECIRAKRHSYEEVIARVHELLSNFRA